MKDLERERERESKEKVVLNIDIDIVWPPTLPMFSLLNLVLLLVLIQDVQPLQIKIGGLFTGIEPPTNNGILSDRNAYPYFARVVAPDTMQASAIAKIVNKFEWKNICILHRDDNYGIQGALATVANAKLNGINVISMKSYNHKTSDAAK